ncbi:hypothetical protein LCGC14_2175290, partial [marine sediment metagenome]
MTWATERLKIGKRRFRVVEMELDFCSLTYGIAPCTAALSSAEPNKCFNTRVSCQDPPNYAPETKTYRFCDPVEGIPKLLAAIPSLKSVAVAPAKIDPGNTLGVRASVSIEFADHRYHDRGVDNYAAERISGVASFFGTGYTPYDQGTYFGKLRARNPYFVGRLLHVLTGYLPWDHNKPAGNQPEFTQAEVLDTLRRHTYVMDQWEGPDNGGSFKVTAKDVLRLTTGVKAECPVQNTGRLSAGINAGVTALTVTPAGTGNAEYAAAGTIRLESELMTFTRTADAFTVVRGTDGTTAAAHAADVAIQQGKRFSSIRVDSIIEDLLTNFAGVSSAYIPTADWTAEADTWLASSIFSTVIVEPTSVETLVNELCREALVYLWWDEIDQEIKYRALRPQDSEATVTEDNA